MTLILSGTNGVSDIDGDASTPAIRGTDANTGIFFPAADTIAFSEGGAEAMRIDSSGRLLLNTTSELTNIYFEASNITPTTQFITNQTGSYSGGLALLNYSAGGFGSVLTIGSSRSDTKGTNTTTSDGTPVAQLNFVGNDGTNFRTAAAIKVAIDGTSGSGDMPGRLEFYTTADGAATSTERARITSAGFFKASNTGSYVNATGNFHEIRSDQTNVATLISNSNASTPYVATFRFTGVTPNNTTSWFLACDDATNDKAFIYSNGSFQSRANSYGGISDVKLKQDIVDANSQWDDIKGLRVVKYRFKDEVAADPNYPSHLGVIAQEAELVSPGLVFESPDFQKVEAPVFDDEGNPVLDEEGNPQVTTERVATGTVTKGVKYSVLYMKAVKALQEAMERIETLEAKVAALEAN